MSTITESVDVEVPAQIGNTSTRWVTSLGGRKREFEAVITEQHPDERVAWKTETGLSHAGVVTFHRLADEQCRVTAQMETEPQGFAETAADRRGGVTPPK